jgi:hypothetical protein
LPAGAVVQNIVRGFNRVGVRGGTHSLYLLKIDYGRKMTVTMIADFPAFGKSSPIFANNPPTLEKLEAARSASVAADGTSVRQGRGARPSRARESGAEVTAVQTLARLRMSLRISGSVWTAARSPPLCPPDRIYFPRAAA